MMCLKTGHILHKWKRKNKAARQLNKAPLAFHQVQAIVCVGQCCIHPENIS